MRKGKKKYASIADTEEEPPQKRSKDVSEDREEFLLISALSGTISTDNDAWLIDSGESKHITGYKI